MQPNIKLVVEDPSPLHVYTLLEARLQVLLRLQAVPVVDSPSVLTSLPSIRTSFAVSDPTRTEVARVLLYRAMVPPLVMVYAELVLYNGCQYVPLPVFMLVIDIELFEMAIVLVEVMDVRMDLV